MNVLVLIVFTFFSLVGSSVAKNNKELFLQAQQLYNNGSYSQAIEKYLQIDNPGSGVWYNAALAAHKAGDSLQVQLFLARAYRQASPTLLRTIEDMRTALSGEKNAEHDIGLWWYMLLISYSRYMSLLAWQLLFLASLLSLCYSWQQAKQLTMLFFGMLLAVIFFGTMVAIRYSDLRQKVFVTAPEVVIRSGKNEKYSALANIPQATIVVVQEQQKNWIKLRYNGKQGWVSQDQVAII